MVKIVADVMGGDFAPQEQVKGCVVALEKDKDLSLILVGDETQIKTELAKYKYDASRIEIVHTTEIITMEEEPAKAVKIKKDSSTVVAFNLLKENKADGLVSSGSTGAVLSAGVIKLGRIKGVSRPALCPLIPNSRGSATLLCDCGANLECKPINYVHFALMATAYAQATYGIKRPKVGLLNNGTEDHKGDAIHQEANALLKEVPCIDYVGNVEGRDIMHSEANVDVVVSDGFTGNIAMKGIEGCGKTVSAVLKKEFKRNVFNMFRYLLVKDIVGGIRSTLDYERIGGAMFLGLPKAVVKGHGNSKAKGFSACIAQAADAVRGGMVEKIKAMLTQLEEQSAQQQETPAGTPEEK